MSESRGNEAQPFIVSEPLVIIGRNSAGEFGIEVHGGVMPAVVVVLLEKVRDQIVRGYPVDRPRKVTPATVVPPDGIRRMN